MLSNESYILSQYHEFMKKKDKTKQIKGKKKERLQKGKEENISEYKSNHKVIRGVFHLRVSAWLENCTFFLQFTLPGTNSEVKCSSYMIKRNDDKKKVLQQKLLNHKL